MSDERYDRSADMRLLDLQREAMGAQPHMLPASVYIDPDPLTADLPDDAVTARSGTILVPLLAAQPSTNLIAGALVTVSLAIANDGNTIAKNVRARISLPADTVYRAGSMTVDGVAADDDRANDFFANGTDLGDILPAARRTLTVKVMIEAGPADIILSPHVSAASGAIYGARTTRLTRAELSRSHIAERPFYEPEDGELVVEPLSPRAHERLVEPPPYRRILPSALPLARQIALQMPPVQQNAPEMPPMPHSPPMPPMQQSPPQIPPVQQTTPVPEPVFPAVPRPFTQQITSPATRPVSGNAAPAVIEHREQITTKVVVPSVRGGTQKPGRKSRAQAMPKVGLDDSVEPVAVLSPKQTEPTTAPAPPEPISKPKPERKSAKAKQKDQSIGASKSPPQIAAPKPRRPVVEPTPSAERSSAGITSDLQLAGKGGPILTVRIDRNRLATLARLFKGPSLGMIAHYLVLNALAATDALPGDGNDRTLAAFVKEQERLLSRALITARLGKTPASDTVAAILPAFPPAIAGRTSCATISHAVTSEVLLVRAFQTNEMVFLERMLSNANAPPFLRAAQLFVGLCGNDVVVASRRDGGPVSQQLTAYATLATTEISRIFLRAKLTRTPELFKVTESSFDDAARNVLHKLETLIT